MSLVKTELTDWIGSIAFDNYAKRNALAADLIAEVIAGLNLCKTQGARAVVLRSACNDKVW
jgi:methylmalonyl-CoA decarboxylase